MGDTSGRLNDVSEVRCHAVNHNIFYFMRQNVFLQFEKELRNIFRMKNIFLHAVGTAKLAETRNNMVTFWSIPRTKTAVQVVFDNTIRKFFLDMVW